MRVNRPVSHPPERNAEGTIVTRLRPIQELRRRVLSCLLWEDAFYETGKDAVHEMMRLVQSCKPGDVANLAVEARDTMYLRHVPLFLVRELARVTGNGSLVADTLSHVIQRPDELAEYLAIYWKGDSQMNNAAPPLSAGSKRGLARAFGKFKPETLAKYDRDGEIKLRDVMRLVHPKPRGKDHSAVYKALLARSLESPDTWEVELSAGKDKKATFERLLTEGKLGGLAFLRNLRNMIDAGVDATLILNRTAGDFNKVLPFRFISAAKYAPRFEGELEQAMFRQLQNADRLLGETALVIDTSPSMFQANISAKSELTRFDAAAALAILIREVCERCHIWAFNSKAYEIPPRRGFALRDMLRASQANYSCGGLAVAAANARGYDRIIVLTDGQWHVMGAANLYTPIGEAPAIKVSPPPLTEHAYMINVSTHKNGVGYGKWTSIDGWSERVLDYVRAAEMEVSQG